MGVKCVISTCSVCGFVECSDLATVHNESMNSGDKQSLGLTSLRLQGLFLLKEQTSRCKKNVL